MFDLWGVGRLLRRALRLGAVRATWEAARPGEYVWIRSVLRRRIAGRRAKVHLVLEPEAPAAPAAEAKGPGETWE